jgi:hypothetical protein
MNEIILQQGGRSLLLHVFQFTRQNATGRYVPKVSWQKVAGAVGFESKKGCFLEYCRNTLRAEEALYIRLFGPSLCCGDALKYAHTGAVCTLAAHRTIVRYGFERACFPFC